MIHRVSTRLRPALFRSGMPGVMLAFVVLIAACSSDDSNAAPTTTPIPQAASVASLDDVVSLAPGQAVGITGEDISVAFHRVAEESRCPAGAECVTSGTAIVVMALIPAIGESIQLEFIVLPGGSGAVETGDYSIILNSLEPDPPPEGGVGADEYRVTFSVSKK